MENNYSATFLNEHGDITITWDDSTINDVKQMIKEKMDQGYKFFLVERKLGFIPSKSELIHVSQLGKKGKILMKDKEVEKLFFDGKVHLSTKKDTSTAKTTGLAKTVSDVITSHTVATRPALGG